MTDTGITQASNALAENKTAEDDEYFELLRQCELSTNYESIKGETPATIFVNISLNEAKALRKFSTGAGLSSAEAAHWCELKTNLDAAIKKVDNLAFVRLSTRSPKDAIHINRFQDRLMAPLREELRNLCIDTGVLRGEETDYHLEMVAVRRALLRSMVVMDAAQAFDLLAYSNNTVNDLARAMDTYERGEAPWSLKIVVRYFHDDLQVEGEFRAFVHDKKLTALTQYFCDMYTPIVPALKTQIQNCVQTYFDEVVAPRVELSDYIVDFAVKFDAELLEDSYEENFDAKDAKSHPNPISGIFIIELNAWSPRTASGLFDWTVDRKVLYGESPFEIRVLEEPLQVYGAAAMQWHGLTVRALQLEAADEGEDSCGVCHSSTPCSVM